MAFTYKSIGNTAVAVVSLLAVGTALWFQRPPGTTNAPRTQDEAEIMTACLERHYAMGRPWVGFFNSFFNGTYATNYTTNLVYASIMFTGGPLGTNGYYFDEPPTGTYTVALSPGGVGTLNSGGAVSLTAGYPILFGYYPIFWYDDAYPSGVVNPYDAEYGMPEDPLVWGYYDYVVAMTNVVTTNTTPQYDVRTNTVGFFPNAPFLYASGLRAAFMSKATAATFSGWYIPEATINLQSWVSSYVSGGYGAWQDKLTVPMQEHMTSVGWIVPEDSYMASGDLSWFGSIIHTNIFSVPLNFFLQWDSIDDWYFGATWGEFADNWQARQQYVWTNYVSLPVAAWRTTTNYATSYVTNRVVGGITNVITNTTYSTTNYVNHAEINTYVRAGDGPGEAVAMVLPFERNDPAVRRVDAWEPEYGGLAQRYAPAFWSTNVYNDMGRALSLLQWIRDYRQPTTNVTWSASYTNGVLSGISATTGFSVAYPSANSSCIVSRGVTNSSVSGTSVLYDFTNGTPFAVDTVLFQQTARVNTNCPSAWDAGPASIASVAAGAVGSSGWWPIDPDAMRTFVDDFARANTTTTTQLVFSMSIPYDCYHVQFSALTNYLDHAPAR